MGCCGCTGASSPGLSAAVGVPGCGCGVPVLAVRTTAGRDGSSVISDGTTRTAAPPIARSATPAAIILLPPREGGALGVRETSTTGAGDGAGFWTFFVSVFF